MIMKMEKRGRIMLLWLRHVKRPNHDALVGVRAARVDVMQDPAKRVMDGPASSAQTQERLGWHPVQPGLISDLGAEHYFGPVMGHVLSNK